MLIAPQRFLGKTQMSHYSVTYWGESWNILHFSYIRWFPKVLYASTTPKYASVDREKYFNASKVFGFYEKVYWTIYHQLWLWEENLTLVKIILEPTILNKILNRLADCQDIMERWNWRELTDFPLPKWYLYFLKSFFNLEG